MTATAGSDASKASGGRRWVWPAVAAVLVLGVLAVGAPNEEGLPYDPASNSEQGTKALVKLIESFGGSVDVTESLPDPERAGGPDVAIVFPGQTAPAGERRLRAWAERGHTVVVLDPYSDLVPVSRSQAGVGGFGATRIEQVECAIPVLAEAKVLKTSGEGVRFGVPDGAQGCYTREDDAFVVSAPEGDGQIVSIGAPSVLTNDNLDEEDNAVLAVNLLAPRPGMRIAFLQLPPGERPQERDLFALIPDGVQLGLVQVGLGFVVYAFFRGRRLGRPISEPQPVLIAGSELVSAVGNLLQQIRNPARAAAILRGDLRRTLADRLGLSPEASPEIIADTAAARAGADPARVRSAVTDYPVSTEAELLAIARLVDEVREEVLHGRTV